MKDKDILEFQGEYRWLSNFWPCEIIHEAVTYPSVEHAYVAAKSDDKDFKLALSKAATPGKAKRLGRGVALKKNWDHLKINYMQDFISQKFSYGSDLGEKLIKTGCREIVEGNRWDDTYWGVCKGEGKNILGKLLMTRRGYLIRRSFEDEL